MRLAITNHDMPPNWWDRSFNRSQLRAIAKAYGIRIGRSKSDMAVNIHRGSRNDYSIATFKVAEECIDTNPLPQHPNSRLRRTTPP